MNIFTVTYNHFGKTEVAIVDDNYLPVCGFLNNYINLIYERNALNTKWTYAQTMLFIYRYFVSKSIDLIDRVRDGKFLTSLEYGYFKRHCMYRVSTENDEKNVLNFAKLSDKQLDNMIHTTRNAQSRVSTPTAKMRLQQLKSYIEYLYKVWHFGNQTPIEISNSYLELERTIKSDIRNLKDDNAVVCDPFESSMPDDVFLRMLEICQPSCVDNPFKGSRLRNHLIIAIWCDTGMRQGALGKLKISDIKDDKGKPRLMVTRTPDDPTDRRKKKAAQKTKAHTSAISVTTMKRLKHYIETCRAQVTGSRTHDFIFISEKGLTKGQPLALKSLYNITQTLSDALNFKVYPHLLRYKWNEIFDRKATALGLKPDVIEDIRKYANGWTEGSKMALIYNQFRYALKNQELSLIRQDDFIKSQIGLGDHDD